MVTHSRQCFHTQSWSCMQCCLRILGCTMLLKKVDIRVRPSRSVLPLLSVWGFTKSFVSKKDVFYLYRYHLSIELLIKTLINTVLQLDVMTQKAVYIVCCKINHPHLWKIGSTLTAKHDAIVYIKRVMFILAHLFPYSEAAGKSETPKYSVVSSD